MHPLVVDLMYLSVPLVSTSGTRGVEASIGPVATRQ
jgi:hypothetical protein